MKLACHCWKLLLIFLSSKCFFFNVNNSKYISNGFCSYRTEEEIGEDDLSQVEVPEDLQQKFNDIEIEDK